MLAVPELFASSECFRLMVEVVEDHAIFMLHPDGRVATWNAGAERLKGFRAAEIVGKPHSQFYSPEDVLAGMPARHLGVAAASTRCEAEGWRFRKDGSRFWAIVVITAVREGGDLIGFVKITREVPDRHRTAEHFRLIIEAAPTGMLMVDDTGCLVMVNGQLENLFGYSRAELIGQRIETLIPGCSVAADTSGLTKPIVGPLDRLILGGRELFGYRKDGAAITLEIDLTSMRTHEGEFVLGTVLDITQRKFAEREREELLDQLQVLNAALEERVEHRTRELTATLKEREVLLQEMHHRVKNNLQVISSMINIQLRQMTDASSRIALEDCQNRIQAIALLHENLYQSKDFANVKFCEYVRTLADSIFHAGVSPSRLSCSVDIEDVSLGLDKAIPCGLILNELISNALKHGFPNARAGTIRVALRSAGTPLSPSLVLCISDDGVGLPVSFDQSRPESLGMQLVTTLVLQLGGTLEISRENGTTFEITFPSAEVN